MDLPQNQNLIVWLRCQLCRGSFPTVNEFIEHKKQWHLTEFKEINSNNSIIFEEVTGNQDEYADETPATTKVNSSDVNLRSQTEIQAGPEPEPEKEVVPHHDASERVQGHTFAQVITPVVLLTRLTLKKIQAASQTWRLSSKKPKSVRLHIRTKKTNAKSKSFKCPKAGCLKKLRTLRSRNIHFATHGKFTSSGRQHERLFHCAHPGCRKSFKQIAGVRRHLETHADSSDRRTLPCQICSKRFFKKACLDTHYREVHGNARPFTCPQPGCTKSFKRKDVAWNHFRTHAAPNDRPLFACKICQLPYLHLKNLKKHCLVVHGADAYLQVRHDYN